MIVLIPMPSSDRLLVKDGCLGKRNLKCRLERLVGGNLLLPEFVAIRHPLVSQGGISVCWRRLKWSYLGGMAI